MTLRWRIPNHGVALIAMLTVNATLTACFEAGDEPIAEAGEAEETGQGDGDPSTGDGDPSTGDGDPSTGDGDPSTGDGDPSTGDGDGEPSCADGDGIPCDPGPLCSKAAGVCEAGVCRCACEAPLELLVGSANEWAIDGPIDGAVFVKVGGEFQGPLSCGEDLFDLGSGQPIAVFTNPVPWEAQLHRPCSNVTSPMYAAFLDHHAATSQWARRALGLPDALLSTPVDGVAALDLAEVELLNWAPNPSGCEDIEVVTLRANFPWNQRLGVQFSALGAGRSGRARISRGNNSTDWFDDSQTTQPMLPIGSGNYTIDFEVPCGDAATDAAMNYGGLWSPLSLLNNGGGDLMRVTAHNVISWSLGLYECNGGTTSSCGNGFRTASVTCAGIQATI
jgi:hypothetical protein